MADLIERLEALDAKDTEQQRQRNQFLSLLDAVIEALPDALVVTTLEGDIIIFNKRAELMFGYHRTEMFGKTVELLIPERDRAEHIRLRKRYSRFDVNERSKTMGIGMNLVGLHRDGHEFRTEITLSRAIVPQGAYVMASLRFAPESRPVSDEILQLPGPAGEIEDRDA